MMMKKFAGTIATISTLGFANLAHTDEFDTAIGTLDASMNATLATDYIWRGQSQTAGVGAIQGGLDIGHESGLYIGVWASNVDSDAFDGGSIEIDYYAGFAGDITGDISYDLQWITYTFPKGVSATDEILASIHLYGLTLGAKYAYESDSALYTYIGYGFALPADFSLDLHFGRTDTKDPLNEPTDTKEKYNDWAVTLGKTFLDIDWALAYTDTNLKGSTCADWYGKSSYCDSNVTFSASKSF